MYSTNSKQYIEYAAEFGVDAETVTEIMAAHNYCNNAECDNCVGEIKAAIALEAATAKAAKRKAQRSA